MDSKKAATLLSKYQSGKTNRNEEKELKAHFARVANKEGPDQVYFQYLQKKRSEAHLGDDFDAMVLHQIEGKSNADPGRHGVLRYWYLAASLALLLTMGVLFRNETSNKNPATTGAMAEVDTYDDPELAFEETKQALLLLSARLNGGSEYASEFAKFEKGQNTLKQN
ncbi:MAG: hypothetical protein HC819_05235 [Cyclobacteriaceae bacterium]|nr:hypothetical protein [Cyclobacteriaceae bacterium]